MAREPIRPGGDVRKNWRAINDASSDLALVESESQRLTQSTAELRARFDDLPIDRFPFRVYPTPNSQRTTPDADWWRKFKVQHGYVNLVKTTGCDDADGEGTTATVITVASGVASYKIWAEVTIVSGVVTASAIAHGASGWTGYPAQSGLPGTYYALLARVDTSTYSAEKRAVIRQFRADDIFLDSLGSGGGVTEQKFVIKSVADDWLVCRTYDIDSVGAETVGATDIKVAKAYTHRKTPFHSVTYNGWTYTYTTATARSATNGTITEGQIFTPPFVLSAFDAYGVMTARKDIIHAVSGMSGGTGVFESYGGTELLWMDTNRDGRAWADNSITV